MIHHVYYSQTWSWFRALHGAQVFSIKALHMCLCVKDISNCGGFCLHVFHDSVYCMSFVHRSAVYENFATVSHIIHSLGADQYAHAHSFTIIGIRVVLNLFSGMLYTQRHFFLFSAVCVVASSNLSSISVEILRKALLSPR